MLQRNGIGEVEFGKMLGDPLQRHQVARLLQGKLVEQALVDVSGGFNEEGMRQLICHTFQEYLAYTRRMLGRGYR